MKISLLTYILGHLFLFLSIYLIVNYNTSNRAYLIAGVSYFVGFMLNLIGYLAKKR